jgi:hypothetical protein
MGSCKHFRVLSCNCNDLAKVESIFQKVTIRPKTYLQKFGIGDDSIRGVERRRGRIVFARRNAVMMGTNPT